MDGNLNAQTESHLALVSPQCVCVLLHAVVLSVHCTVHRKWLSLCCYINKDASSLLFHVNLGDVCKSTMSIEVYGTEARINMLTIFINFLKRTVVNVIEYKSKNKSY